MRIEILHSEQEALDRIHHLREQGIRENQLSVIHDVYRDIDRVEEHTDIDTIEVREDTRDESVFDRFVNWVSGRDTLDNLFRDFDVAEQDQNLYVQAVHDGKILLAIEEDTEIADTTFRAAHIGERPPEEQPLGDTEPVDPFIGGTHHPDGTVGPVSHADPYAGSVPEFQDDKPPRYADDEHLRIDEPNYVTDEDLHRVERVEETEEARIREQARREELNDGERRLYEDGDIAEGDLRKPGEPLFGDGPKPPGYAKDEIATDYPESDVEGHMLEAEQERLLREEELRRGDIDEDRLG